MTNQCEAIPDDRDLTAEETALTHWLLMHGKPGIDSELFARQLAQARVVSRCHCGCASIDFAIAGMRPQSGAGLHVLSDYLWTDDDGSQMGIFIFAKAGMLAGLEVWSMDGKSTPMRLPKIASLRPMIFGQGS
ncbi:MAG: hypothetical protein NTW19_18055 [Planctomycetota bacterium]|nr:hypothetical protein [Planctomycetota bacterium]